MNSITCTLVACTPCMYIVLSLKGHSQQLPIRQRSRGHVGVSRAVLFVHIGQVCKSWNLSPFVEAFYFVPKVLTRSVETFSCTDKY